MQEEMSADQYQKLLNKKRGPAKVRFNSASGQITESEVQTSIMDWLSLNQIFHWRQNTGFFKGEYKTSKKGIYGGEVHNRVIRFGHPGTSDILGLLPNGRFLAIEVKRPGGKPTEAQLEFIDNINANGGLAFVSDNLDKVIEIIEPLIK